MSRRPGVVLHYWLPRHAWNDRREQMLALFVELAEATTGIAEGFEYIDRELGAGLRGATS